jgi:hypothetical protein
MALFTDASVVTLDDLLQFETSLVQVASSHGINVDTKINLSMSAISDKVMLWLLRAGISDPQSGTRQQLGLSTVVVTPTLRRWICFDALAKFFAEAYNVQLNTRFQGKWNEYQTQAIEAASMVFMAGVGVVYNPLQRPRMPMVSIQDGSAPAQSIFLQSAWVDGQGNEGTLSPVNGQILSGDSGLVVAMAEGALEAPDSAIGWNLYASNSQSHLTRQNDEPLPIGSTWQLPSTGLVDGPQAVDGQRPDCFVTLTRGIQRG